MDPIQLLIYFVIGIIVLGVIWYATGAMGIPQPLSNIILLIAALLVLLWLLRATGLF
jgi:hypothetical protein